MFGPFEYSGDLNSRNIWMANFHLFSIQMPGNSLLIKPWSEYQTKSSIFKQSIMQLFSQMNHSRSELFWAIQIPTVPDLSIIEMITAVFISSNKFFQKRDAQQDAEKERRERGVRLTNERRLVARETPTSWRSIGRSSQVLAAVTAVGIQWPFDAPLCFRDLLPERFVTFHDGFKLCWCQIILSVLRFGFGMVWTIHKPTYINAHACRIQKGPVLVRTYLNTNTWRHLKQRVNKPSHMPTWAQPWQATFGDNKWSPPIFQGCAGLIFFSSKIHLNN